ncbi:DJ-1/PfpI family protein [Liquorilactobacillus hordei]|uniref:DJ-1/PfpI family protein n=1 Tax=Liquorilactobacillus hordei TaxID=468911 RepID=UPI001CBC60CC|nr:DJ-1/PfpI family protein [Liquorilactobacillus hordei]MBZ2404974.1 glutamine amidotransferase [Liquorilactobacillus hordei]
MKTAIFLILDDYADWEGSYLASQLNQSSDWCVSTASIKPQVTSIGGFKTNVDYLLTEIPQKIDLLVLIGGNSWSISNKELRELIVKQLSMQQLVAAICGAVDFLAQNGLLTNYKHTGNSQYLWQNYSEYTNQGDFIKKQAVIDNNLVTANGTATLQFTKLVLKLVNFLPEVEIDKALALHELGFYKYCATYGNPYQ